MYSKTQHILLVVLSITLFSCNQNTSACKDCLLRPLSEVFEELESFPGAAPLSTSFHLPQNRKTKAIYTDFIQLREEELEVIADVLHAGKDRRIIIIEHMREAINRGYEYESYTFVPSHIYPGLVTSNDERDIFYIREIPGEKWNDIIEQINRLHSVVNQSPSHNKTSPLNRFSLREVTLFTVCDGSNVIQFPAIDLAFEIPVDGDWDSTLLHAYALFDTLELLYPEDGIFDYGKIFTGVQIYRMFVKEDENS